MASGYTLPTSKNIWDFDPTSIAGCSLWLDGADGNTLFSDAAGTTPATAGGNILRWTDKSTLRLPALTNNISTASFNGIYGINPPTLSTDSLTGKTAVNFGVGTVTLTASTSGTNTITCTSSITLQQRQPIQILSPIGSISAGLYYVYNPTGTPTTSFQLTANPNTVSLVSATTVSGLSIPCLIGSASMLLPFGIITTSTTNTSTTITITTNTNTFAMAVGQSLYPASTTAGFAGNVAYYVVSVTNTGNVTTAFTVASTPGGPAIAATSNSSFNWTVGTINDINATIVPGTFPINKTESSMFVVAKYASPVANTPVGVFGYGGSTAGAGRFISLTGSTTAELNYNTSGTSNAALPITGLNADSTNILSTVQSNTTLSGWRNGTFVTPFDLATNYFVNWNTTATVATVGGRFDRVMYGQIMEILHFNVPMSTVDRQTIEGYLAWKWGIQSSLPADHPYNPTIVQRPLLRNFVPTDIDGCQVWLDPADSTAVTISGGFVTSITDKSGNGNTFSNVSSALTYGTTLNGLPSLTGTNGSSANTLLGPVLTRDPYNHSYFVVYRYPTLGSVVTTNFLSASGNSSDLFQITASGNNIDLRDTFNTQSATGIGGTFRLAVGSFTGLQVISGNTFVVSGVRQNAFFNMTCNGIVSNGGITNNNATYNTGAQNTPTVQFTLGMSTSGGQFGDIIIYNTALTTAQRQMIEGYLMWKWGIRTGTVPVFSLYTTPSSHPYFRYPPPALTFFTPELDTYKTTFNPSDLSPAVWLDPADSSVITTDTNGRILTILNKGSIAPVSFAITQVASNVDLTINSTAYLTVGTLLLLFDAIPGSPGTTGSTAYYVSSVSGSVIRIATSVANAFAGTHISTLTNGTVSVFGYIFMTFARPTAGTGTGILGPLLTDSRIIAPRDTTRNIPFMDFSSGGTYTVTAGTIAADTTTLTLTVNPAHNGGIPVGKMIFLNFTSGVSVGSASLTTNTGPYQIISAHLYSSTILVLTINTTGQFSLNGSIYLTLNEATYNGGADASGLTGAYTVPAANVSITATSATTSNITLTSVTGIGIGSAISFTTNYAGLSANVVYYVFSISGNDVGISTLPMGIGFARRTLTSTASGASGSAGTGGFATTLTIPTNANTLGLMAVSDGHVRINSGVIGYYLTQAGTTGSSVVVSLYGARAAGALANINGYITYGNIPFSSAAVTATNTLTVRTIIPHGLSPGDVCAINFISSGMCSPFQIPIRTSGTTLTEMATQFTTATISGTTLTITLATNPFYIGNPPTTYVGLSSFRVVLPYGTTYSNGSDASGILVATGGVSQAGSNSTKLVLIITAASPVDGSLIFGGLPGMIDTGVNPLSSTSSFNSTQTLSAGTTGNTLIIPFGSIGTPVSQLNGKFLFLNSSGQLALPSNVFAGYNGAAIYIASPVNGRALECPNLSSTFNSSTATIAWTAFLNPFGNAFTRGIGSQGGSTNQSIIGNAATLNGTAGGTSTSYAIAGGFSGSASRYNIRMNGGSLVTPTASSDSTISPFRVNTAYLNMTNSVDGEVGPNSAGLITNGGRFTNACFQQETVAGGWIATTLTLDQIRIGGDTIATTNYATYPLQSFWYEGGLGDIFMFNRILSVEERQLLEGYLAHKYRCNNFLGATGSTSTPNTFATYTITGGSVTGSGPWTHTLTFATATQFAAVGAQVTISGVTNPTALNGTYTITLRSTTSVTFLASTTGSAWVSGGTVTSVTTANATYLHPYRISNPVINPTTTPTSTYALGLTAWFDATNANSFTYSSGSVISAWTPTYTSISGLSLTQATTSYQPSLVQNAQNGLPGVRFTYVTSPSTSGKLLVSSAYASRNFVTQGQSPESTIFVVTKRLQSATSVIVNIAGGGNSRHLLNGGGGETVYADVGGTDFRSVVSMTSVPSIGTPYIFTFNRRGTQTSIRTNGSSNGSATNPQPINFSNITMTIAMGAYASPPTSLVYGGDIYELIIFRYSLTDTTINQIEGYLAWKWGIQSSLPTGHPYSKIRV
jgi:hypothetical protein